MNLTWRRSLAALAWAAVGVTAQAADLPELNIDLKETTVSGISSGAFMAVQMGVAKSASVRGVAVTAGGPYFCALKDSQGSNLSFGVMASMARCMQGDPMYPAQPITKTQLQDMAKAARDWGQQGKIDPVSNLARQAVWVFHGYNDGIVKRPVSDALVQWYAQFTPASQIFHKDDLNAAHAQISAACTGDSCNPCATTGKQFINACTDRPSASPAALYDAAGAALQMFYGPLERTATEKLGAKAQDFSQTPYLKLRGGSAVSQPADIAMGGTGYVYVPQACKAGQPCRLHIAFHGCMQSAATLGRAFVDGAGVNEWADANRLVVLYPQAMPTYPVASMSGSTPPLNPNGCWDWWGYNDKPKSSWFDPFGLMSKAAPVGTYATAEGLQVAAVWRMAQKLAAKGAGASAAPAVGTAAPQLLALDRSDDQVMLRWQPVSGASGYRVYRSSASQPAQALGSPVAQLFWVDAGLQPQGSYRYTVRAVADGKEGQDSNAVSLSTAARAPTLAQCNPYFSLSQNKPVKKSVYAPMGVPTTDVCP
jgi:poly(3-hydroxybutyrate) depolymerase